MVEAYYPDSLEKALHLLNETKGIPFAGGTDLMVRYRAAPGVPPDFRRPIICIGGLQELRDINRAEGFLRIGAAVTMAELLERDDLPPGLREAITGIGAPAIRNMATVGGNICNASPAADTLPALYCLDASVEVIRGNNRAIHPIQEFITGPGTRILKPGDLLFSILVPESPPFVTFYRKVGTRRAQSLSKLSFLGLHRLEKGLVADMRIAFGAASPRVLRIPEAEDLCIGASPEEIVDNAGRIIAMYEGKLSPIDDQRSTAAYRKRTALRLLEYYLTKELVQND